MTIAEKTIAFSVDKLKWARQQIIGFLSGGALIGLVVGSAYYASELGSYRAEKILNNGPKKTTIAEVESIEMRYTYGRYGKSSNGNYAIFEYKAGNEIIDHPVLEDDVFNYLIGEEYEIQYSTEYPEIFRILRKMPN